MNDGPQNENENETPEPAEVPPEDAPESDAPAETPAADAEQAPEAEAAAEEAPPADPAPKTEDGGKTEDGPKTEDEGKQKGDVAPGAELDPIALEPEPELDAEERARLEAEAEEQKRRERELEEVEQPVAVKPAKLHADSRYTATGKRKSSVARVIISAGGGEILVNSRKLEDYFPRSYLQSVAKQPLVQTGYDESVDVRVRVHGGGVSGQASAVRHGIAKALCDVDPELRRELKRRGMLTRDARIKERRKAGLKKARKRPQFSKR